MSNTELTHSIVIYDKHLSDGSHYVLKAYLDASGHLVFEGYDTGPLVQATWGDSDYEYWLKIDAEHVPQVLLELIKDRFETDSEFRQWLDRKGIPCHFDSWT